MTEELQSPPDWPLSRWLQYLEQLHPREIDLGLDRVRDVAQRLDLLSTDALLITVAGTNGKGSCVASLDGLLRAHGISTVTYTSPHLLRYNERIHIDGRMADDAAICDAFLQIEQARHDTSLTYFEFGTLAALLLARTARPDALILETGLGGRLDAVNIMNPDVTMISSIGLDHQQWLGPDRETIGREKAGIFRPGRPVVCADPDPPASLRAAASTLSSPWYGVGGQFDWEVDSSNATWRWRGTDVEGRALVLDELPLPALALSNVAAALQALALTPFWSRLHSPATVMPQLALAGRQQPGFDTLRQRRLLLDVAHNAQAAAALARAIETRRQQGLIRGAVHVVLAMMSDKDHEGFFRALEPQVDFWYITQVDQARCLPAPALHDRFTRFGAAGLNGPYTDVADAYQDACRQSGESDTIIICGSFFTVSAIIQWLGTPSFSESGAPAGRESA